METDSQGFKNKNFLIVCIRRALDELKKQQVFKNIEFDFQEGLSGIGGTPRVAEIMMKRARECDIFIGDMTITQRLGELSCQELAEQKSFLRLTPNANVLMEYAIALNKETDFWEQVVLIMNKVNGDVHDNVELFPFDIREERFPITFELGGDAKEEHKEKVTNILIEPLRLAAIAAIKRHKNKFKPLKSWEDQEYSACYSRQYEWTPQLELFRDTLLSEKNDIRLLGLSGYGKTRLVVESFRKVENKDGYLYADTQVLDVKEIYSLALRVFEEYKEAILVVDNCDNKIHKMLRDLRNSCHVKTKLITIFNDPAERQNPECTYVKMEDVQNEVAERIFRSYREFKDESEHKYFLYATGGNPMIAEMLVKVLKEGNVSGRMDDADLMTKLLGYDENSVEREAMRSLALFTELEYDDKATEHDVIEYVAKSKSILNVTIPDGAIVNWITEVIRVQIRRGNIEKIGNTIRIRPQMLRDGLFTEWQEHCDTGRLIKVITEIESCVYKDKLSAAINGLIYSLTRGI